MNHRSGRRGDRLGWRLTGIGVALLAAWLMQALPCQAADDDAPPPRNARDAFDAATAFAVPLKDIKIDGKLDDWPEDLPRYPIYNEFQVYGPGRGDDNFLQANDDLDAYFMVGYNAKAGLIYVAVVVRDDEPIVAWGETLTDVVELFLDNMPREEQNRACLGRRAAQFVGAAGDGGYIGRNGQHLNPSYSQGQPMPDPGAFSFSNEGNTAIYEWALPAAAIFPGEEALLKPGRRLGFDVVVMDKDRPGDRRPKWVAWGPSVGYKFINTAALGDLVLLARIDDLKPVTGVARQAPGGKPAPRALLEFWRGDAPAGFAQTDKDGAYRALLPKGKYEARVSAGQGVAATQPSELAVAGDAPTAWDPIVVPMPLPEVLQRVIDKYAALKTYADRTTMALNVLGGVPATSTCSIDAVLQRGNGLRMSFNQADGSVETVVSDGKSMAVLSPVQHRALAPVPLPQPLSLGVVASLSTQRIAGLGGNRNWHLASTVGTGAYPHRLAMASDSARLLRYRLESVKSLGPQQLDDEKLIVIELVKQLSSLIAGAGPWSHVSDAARLQLWIDEKTLLIRQTVIIVPPIADGRALGMGFSRQPMIFTTRHTDIHLDKPIERSQFAMPEENEK